MPYAPAQYMRAQESNNARFDRLTFQYENYQKNIVSLIKKYLKLCNEILEITTYPDLIEKTKLDIEDVKNSGILFRLRSYISTVHNYPNPVELQTLQDELTGKVHRREELIKALKRQEKLEELNSLENLERPNKNSRRSKSRKSRKSSKSRKQRR